MGQRWGCSIDVQVVLFFGGGDRPSGTVEKR